MNAAGGGSNWTIEDDQVLIIWTGGPQRGSSQIQSAEDSTKLGPSEAYSLRNDYVNRDEPKDHPMMLDLTSHEPIRE